MSRTDLLVSVGRGGMTGGGGGLGGDLMSDALAVVGGGSGIGSVVGGVVGSIIPGAGTIVGGTVGGIVDNIIGGGGGPKTSQGGPGSHSYWQSQLERLQKNVTHKPGVSAAVVEYAKGIIKQYKALNTPGPGDPYPVIPEEVIAALEKMAADSILKGGNPVPAPSVGGSSLLPIAAVLALLAWRN